MRSSSHRPGRSGTRELRCTDNGDRVRHFDASQHPAGRLGRPHAARSHPVVESFVNPSSLGSRIIMVALGVCFGTAAGLPLAVGDVGAVIALCVVGALLGGLIYLMVPADQRARVALVVALAFALRSAFAALSIVYSVGLGGDGTFRDDQGYAYASQAIARYLHGQPGDCLPPTWCGLRYQFGPFVYLTSGVFFVFGPDIALAEILNSGMGAALVVFAWDLGRRVFPTSTMLPALVIAVAPPLVAFSGLVLKDALAVLLVAVALWATVRFQERGQWRFLFVALAAIEPMLSTRYYAYYALLLTLVVSMVFWCVPRRPELLARLSYRAQVLRVAGSFVLAAAMWVVNGIPSDSFVTPNDVLPRIEQARIGLSEGGRTSYGNPSPQPTGAPTPQPTGAPTPQPTGAPTPQPTGAPTPQPTGAPTPQPTGAPTPQPTGAPTPQPTGAPTPQPTGAPAPTSALAQSEPPRVVGSAAWWTEHGLEGNAGIQVLVRTLQHLPRGVWYALLAPFPWAADRLSDRLVIPDMLMWYLVAVAAPISLWKERRRWRDWFPVAFFSLVLFGLFALAEGNVGTLYRHRAFGVMPFAAILAGPTLVATHRAIRKWLTRDHRYRRS